MRTIVNTLGRDKHQVKGSRGNIRSINADQTSENEHRDSYRNRSDNSDRSRRSEYSDRRYVEEGRHRSRNSKPPGECRSERYLKDDRRDSYYTRNSRGQY